MSSDLEKQSFLVSTPAHNGWGSRTLADGRSIPEIGFGSASSGKGDVGVQGIKLALDTGFVHIDTAQNYRNEPEVGQALATTEEGSTWITTKFSGTSAGNKSVTESLHDSLDNLQVKAVDLYLIHSPRWCDGKIVEDWAEILENKKLGLVRSAGVSNFSIENLEELRKAGLETPVVNQIELHPYIYGRYKKLLDYHAANDIVTEAYSPLKPLTRYAGGPLDVPVKKIADAHGVPPAEIYLAWARAKGGVVLTASRQKDRLESYLHAGHLRLSEEEIAIIDKAGASLERRRFFKQVFLVALVLTMTLAWIGVKSCNKP